MYPSKESNARLHAPIQSNLFVLRLRNDASPLLKIRRAPPEVRRRLLCHFVAGQRCEKRKERVRGSVNKAVDVLMPWHDRVSASMASLSLSLSPLGCLLFRARRSEMSRKRREEAVIIKSCNQLANLSSSVLIKPGPPDFLFSLSLFLSASRSFSSLISRSLSLSFSFVRAFLFWRLCLYTRNYSYRSHFVSRLRRQFFIPFLNFHSLFFSLLLALLKLFLTFFINSRESYLTVHCARVCIMCMRVLVDNKRREVLLIGRHSRRVA